MKEFKERVKKLKGKAKVYWTTHKAEILFGAVIGAAMFAAEAIGCRCSRAAERRDLAQGFNALGKADPSFFDAYDHALIEHYKARVKDCRSSMK